MCVCVVVSSKGAYTVKMECDFNTFLCGSCDYSSKVATIITRSIQKCVKITFHFLQCRSEVCI